jgi:organic hydroperoxide reductase OsmC/OhrA
MERKHYFTAALEWKGNRGQGTRDYRAYDRDFIITISNKPEIHGSAEMSFRGDKSKHNPEDLFLASIASCHMLWYLHLCADEGVVVTSYIDHPTCVMVETPEGAGYISEVTLHPVVTVTDRAMSQKANELHAKAKRMCFISNSVSCPVAHKPVVKVEIPVARA